MCMSCGCGKPNEKHGDDRHITQTQLEQAAQAANITPMQAAQNMMNACQQMGMGTGQTQQMQTGASPSTQA